MKINDKYELLRPRISDGDVILFHGNGFIAKTIQWCDSSYYNHVGVVFESHGALYIIDANSNGVQVDRLSYRISKYKNGDFTILKPLINRSIIDIQMKGLLMRSDNKTINYDFNNGIKELINRKFKANLEISQNPNRTICSRNVREYMINLHMVNNMFSKLKEPFPQDCLRYANTANVKILG